jgi:SAM-dependent methyltransferase
VHEDGYFDARVAARYDETSADRFAAAAVDPAVDFLQALAGDGRALELGIGTGRIALPLARRGVPVHGIELSRAMVEQLRAKPGGEDIEVTIGDFASAKAEKTFRVAYLVFNTIMNLTTQQEQVACFQNVAAHLEPGGCFVIDHYRVGDGTVRSIPFRCVWPAELDLMARLAGMELRERWSDWKREPFTSTSTKHVSVWEKIAG